MNHSGRAKGFFFFKSTDEENDGVSVCWPSAEHEEHGAGLKC